MTSARMAFYGYAGVLLTVIILGIYNWVVMLTKGMGVTGLSDMVQWGVLSTGLIFFIGASAGATIIGLMIHAFGRDDYKPIGTRAIILGFLSLTAAVLFLLAHVGLPFRAVLMPWVLRNPTSVYIVSSISYYIFMALLLAELYLATRINRGIAGDKDKRIAKWLGIIAVPFALWVVHAFTGSIFGVVAARELWNTPLVPAHFVVSALATGVAIVILVTILSSKIAPFTAFTVRLIPSTQTEPFSAMYFAISSGA